MSNCAENHKCRSFAGHELARRSFADFAVSETRYLPDQEIPTHSHNFSYISIALQGSYTEDCCSVSSDILPGQVILHVPGESHSNRFHKIGGRVLNVELYPSFLARLAEFQNIQPDGQRRLRNSYGVQLGTRLYKEFSCEDVTSCWSLEGLTMELMAEIFRHHAPKIRESNCAWLGKVIELLKDTYRQPMTLEEIAAHVSVHPVHLARAFKKRHHCSIGEYVRRMRLEAACRELLGSKCSIAEVALRTGFSDQSHLCRSLKEYSGMSPRQYRESHS